MHLCHSAQSSVFAGLYQNAHYAPADHRGLVACGKDLFDELQILHDFREVWSYLSFLSPSKHQCFHGRLANKFNEQIPGDKAFLL
jgi:hypothetical protein